LNITDTFQDEKIPTKVEKSFGNNAKRLSSTIGIPLSTEGIMRLWITKTAMERSRPSWGS
jgi:hypothetical protein